MKSRTIISAIMAMSLVAGATGGSAFAQGNRDRDDRGRNEPPRRDGQQDRRDNDRRDNRNDRNDRDNRNRGNSEAHRNDRGAGPNHQFHRGDRLPVEYRHRHYVVEDWRGHRLSAPPRGYHWVQSGGDYLLVAIATGVILQLFLNN